MIDHKTPNNLEAARRSPALAETAAGRSGSKLAPRALGIYAGNPSPPSQPLAGVDKTTGEIPAPARDLRASRAERFILKAMAGRLLPQGSRTSKCMRWRVPNRDMQVVYSPAYQKANFQGLQVCASPWACPVCASKIAERRRVEVAAAIATAKASGLTVELLTLTFPHGLGDDLGTITSAALKAYSKLFSGKAGCKLRERIDLQGTIRALEVTHGENGWHPHFHVLMFSGRGVSVTSDQVQADIALRWQNVCVSSGLPRPSLSHGCRVDGGDKAAGYVAKGATWGLESELTRGQAKIAKGRKGRSPFALLRDYADGDKQAGALFSEYARVFEGKRQLVWSNGLKRRFAVSEVSDDELANAIDDTPTRRLALLTDDQWRLIYRARLESVVLDLAELAPESLAGFLASLPGRYPPTRATHGDRVAGATAPPSDQSL